MLTEKLNGLTVVYRKVKEGYIAYAMGMPGINTQGANLKETRENVRDATQLILEVNSQN